jgi:adenylate cyclase
VHAFFALVDRLSTAGADERTRLEAEIWDRFGVEKALLALDMSHFSLSVSACMRRMRAR